MSLARPHSRALFTRQPRRGPRAHEQAPALHASPLTGTADGEHGILLARRLGGERALPTNEGMVVLSLDRLRRHMLVCGATGAGKTETLLRIAWTVAKTTDAAVFYLDGKGDRDTAQRFCALMSDASRRTRVFPNEPFDAWRGQPHELHGRLMEIIDYASDGPASWYRDLAKTVLRLVCEHPAGPPRNASTLLERIDQEALQAAHPDSSALAALTKEQIRQVRLRYEAFFGQTRGALDGDWAWEDTSAAYLLLDSLALKEETVGLSRLLFEDFAHYFTSRKPRQQFCVLIVDEFSALAGSGMAARVEQARGFNTGLILAPQVTAGMGDPIEAERITGSAETVICHPRQHTRADHQPRRHQTSSRALHPLRARRTHRRGISPHPAPVQDRPNKVRALPPGHVYIINAAKPCAPRSSKRRPTGKSSPSHLHQPRPRRPSSSRTLASRPYQPRQQQREPRLSSQASGSKRKTECSAQLACRPRANSESSEKHSLGNPYPSELRSNNLANI